MKAFFQRRIMELEDVLRIFHGRYGIEFRLKRDFITETLNLNRRLLQAVS